MPKMTKKILTIAAIALVVSILVLIYLAFGHKKAVAPTVNAPQNQAKTTPIPTTAKTPDDVLKNALNLYLEKKREGLDMQNGPCLGKIADDWVLDIAHNPRQPIDEKPENQCTDFKNGLAGHFIELDPEGKLIKLN